MKVRSLSAALALVISVTPRAEQQPQRFTSNVNILAVDVRVVDKDGQPILGLLPADFSVTINRHDRRVVSADLVQYSSTANPPPLVNIAPAVHFTPGRVPEDNRVFVIALDNSSFSAGGIKPAVLAAQRFVKNLRPNDMVGLYVFPFERPTLALTHDHKAVHDALSRQIGRREDQHGQYRLRPSEIIDITAGDKDALKVVVDTECRAYAGQISDVACPDVIRAEASMAAAYYESEASQRLYGLGLVIQDLGFLPGRKTVVIVSGGMLAANRAGARPNISGFMGRLGQQAARSNVGTYVIHMDDTYLDFFSAAQSPSRRVASQTRSVMGDEAAFSDGLMRLAGETGGTYLPVKAGTGDMAFGRVLRETMAYYLLGVEPTTEDFTGRKLLVQVKTRARGAVVRALREVIAK